MICTTNSTAELVKPGGFAGLTTQHIMAEILHFEIPYLIETAGAYLEKRYDTNISNYIFSRKKSGWKPSLICSISNNFLIFAEASVTPFPETFKINYADMLNHAEPIAAYSICPERAWHDKKHSKDIDLLRHKGFGLITISNKEKSLIRFTASPIALWISEADFKSALVGLDSRRLKNEIKQAFDDYKVRPQMGVAEITSILQQMISKSLSDAIKENWLGSDVNNYNTLECLEKIYQRKNFRSIKAEIEGVRAFFTKFRNPGNTQTKSRREAQIQFKEFRHGFLEGIEHIKLYRAAMKSIGLSGNLGAFRN